jgi:hypothetical protein
MARPTKFSQELADKICETISTSNKGLRTICKEEKISVSSVLNWLRDTENKEFLAQYARAKQEQADHLAEEIIAIADDSSDDLKGVDDYGNRIENKEFVNRSKLRVDARKWVAAKLAPKKYGDKLDTTIHVQKLGKDLADETYE